MKNLIKLEEVAIFAGTLLASFPSYQGQWWQFALLLFAPDLSAVGYLVNTRVGAFAYNLVHHRGVAMLVYFAGIYIESQVLVWAGVITFLHSTLDRALGYGLKFPDSFQNTHLGPIGRAK
jgi:hypothetical protein